MRKRATPFNVTRNGFPIEEVGVRNSVDPGIQYSFLFLQFEACIAAGLDLYKWWNDEYDVDFKAHVVGWHQDSNLVKLHTNDAVNAKMEQEAKRARKR